MPSPGTVPFLNSWCWEGILTLILAAPRGALLLPLGFARQKSALKTPHPPMASLLQAWAAPNIRKAPPSQTRVPLLGFSPRGPARVRVGFSPATISMSGRVGEGSRGVEGGNVGMVPGRGV